ncbi:hypothetical protein M408DRAFT_26024 [Serendipita vermifera MAFF 305830]|uniref:F-box domain-containing protein n=1 Tax=Serendipita vermifera MAFF 305830 TaxID=933852 RepID=A0A0C3B0H2_SERVB|nr:hypothetical protein M408DRAFT_26024 [Serendipita vermifera MAFF 305830]
MTFVTLPPELVVQIFSLIYPLEIARCRQINRYILYIIESSTALQLRIQLAIDGLLLDPSFDDRKAPASGHILEHVVARRQAFHKMKPFSLRIIQQHSPERFSYERCDGLWAHAGDKVGRLFNSIHYDALVPFDKNSRNLSWSHQLGFPMRDLIFWGAGDLQVLLEVKDGWTTRTWHFRTLSTNEIHPLAKSPTLELKRGECKAWGYANFLLYEESFGVVLSESLWQDPTCMGEVIIWNWIKGKVVLPLTHALDATLLSKDCLLTLIAQDGQIEVAIMCLSSGKTTYHLRLPQGIGHIGAHILRHPCYNTSNRDFGPHAQTFAALCPSFPVTPDISVDIVLVEFQHTRLPPGYGSLLVLSKSHLLQLHRNQLERTAAYDDIVNEFLSTPIALEWESWGPKFSRWLPPGFRRASGSCVFGSRILAFAPRDLFEADPVDQAESIPSPIHIVLLDFNQRAVVQSKNDAAKDGYRETAIISHTSPWSPTGCRSVIYDSDPGLRFRAIISEHPTKYKSVYLDGNAFICRNLHSYDIFSFLSDPEGSSETGAGVEGF